MHCLKKGQSIDITFSDSDEIKTSKFLNIESGVLRISLVSKINSEQFPLGFFGSESLILDKDRLRDCCLRLEALNEVRFKVAYTNDSNIKAESIFHNQWLLILCMIKSSHQVEIRICRLVAILVCSFGNRNKENYTLPFELSHSQIAMLVGCTRSTVTRQIGLLKAKEMIYLDKSNNRILVSENLINQESAFINQLLLN